MFDVDKIWDAVIAVLLAMAGGFARLLNVKDKTKLRLSRIFSELFISGFAGLMVLLLAHASGLSGDWIGIAAGMSGWVGPKALDVVVKAFGKVSGVDMDKKEAKEE